MQGVRVPVLTRKSPQADAEARSEKTTFQAGMCMKTKRTRCQVSGARCQGARLDSEVPAGGCGMARSQKTTFQAGMCMKTKEGVRSPGVRSPKSKGVCGGCACSDSRLLTPDSCSSRNEGASGDVVENKGDKKERVGFRCKGIHLDSAVQAGGLGAAGSEKTRSNPECV